MFTDAFGASWQTLVVVALSTGAIYLTLIVFSRIAGLRSFSQMSNFDMAAAIAFGSMMATTALSSDTPLLVGVVGLGVLFAIQWLLAQVRRLRRGERVLDSTPLLLMSGDDVMSDHLAVAQMTRNDLRAKLRLAGVTRYDQVGAVILEISGDVSVLMRGPDDQPMDPDLFAGVRGRERLFTEEDLAE